MKAFSPDIFTEQTQAALKEDAHNLTIKGKNYASSILEFDEAFLSMEKDMTRTKYIGLLESQKQGLEIIDESFFGTAIMAALIGVVIGFIGSMLKLLTGKEKTVTFKIPYFDKEKDTRGQNERFNVKDFVIDMYGGAYKLPCANPYINKSIKLTSEFDSAAANKTVNITEYIYPNRDVVYGNFDSLEDVIEIGRQVEEIFTSIIKRNQFDGMSEKIDALDEKIDTIRKNIEHLNHSGSTNEVSMNAKQYLNKSFEWCDGYVPSAELWKFNDDSPNPNLTKLNEFLSRLHITISKFDPNTKGYNEYQGKVWNKAVGFEKRYCNLVLSMSRKMVAAYNAYWHMVSKEITQMNRVSASIAATGGVKESAIFENEYYQNSPELQEYMFGEDTVLEDCSEIYTEFCQMIDDTNSRMNIYRHQTEMKAMNEEALIFSETGISDYEKFQRLQAVNEALGNKIKKAYYNTVAALKEIFRKFMEKLTANFTPTKTYLDRYKKIILGTPFNNYELKIQDMPTAIERIERATVPQLNYNALAQQAPDFGTFFGEVKKDLPENGDSKIKQSDVQTVGDANEWFKSYFCMQDHELNTNGKWFQQNVKNFYDFLYDINKINKSIRDSLKSIDDTVTSITKTAGSTQQEAVYSILYQKWFTLNENGVLVEVEVKAPENPAAPQGGQQQQTGEQTPANKVQNIKQNDDADNSNAKNDARGDVEARLKIYTDVCSSLLKAKMSAVEFVRNELMTVIRKHVQDHINAKPQQQQQQAQAPAKQQ